MKSEEKDTTENDRKKRIERIQKELGMTEESIERDVIALQHWLHRQPHLGPITGTDEKKWLTNYLTLCKNSIEKAKIGIDLYFKLRTTLPELFENRDATGSLMEASFNATCLTFLPKLTDKGHRIVTYSHFTNDATQFDPWTLAKRILMMLDINLLEGTKHSGIILLTDLSNSRKGHLAKYPLSMINKMLNTGWIMIHNSLDTLKENISLDILPSDYGGNAPSLKELNREWQTKMIQYKKWLEESAKHCSKEELRKHGYRCNEEEMDGTFRKLNID
ncbi:uncharacterized protein LOC142332196 isoform X2 [Lycorma delicatula]|uniref:uncharacterized protein LOC142332196 isoform X2 n=1 Tax=Lycorma delicatula TaxID=130591 RepID=UPI003F51102C